MANGGGGPYRSAIRRLASPAAGARGTLRCTPPTERLSLADVPAMSDVTVERIWKAIVSGRLEPDVWYGMIDVLVGPSDWRLGWYASIVDIQRRSRFTEAATRLVREGTQAQKLALAMMFDPDKLDEASERFERLARGVDAEAARGLATRGALLAPVRPRDAINSYARLTALDKANVVAHHEVARLAYETGDVATAGRWFLKTMEVADPSSEDFAWAMYGTGLVLATSDPAAGERTQYEALMKIEDRTEWAGVETVIRELQESAAAREDHELRGLCDAWLEEHGKTGGPALYKDVAWIWALNALRDDELDRALSRFDEAIGYAEEVGDEAMIANALVLKSHILCRQRDPGSVEIARDGVARLRTLNAPADLAAGLEHLGDALQINGRLEESEDAREEGRAVYENLGDEESTARILLKMAAVDEVQDQPWEAARRFEEALRQHSRLGDHASAVDDAVQLARISAAAGQHERGIAYLRQALTHLTLLGGDQSAAAEEIRRAISRLQGD